MPIYKMAREHLPLTILPISDNFIKQLESCHDLKLKEQSMYLVFVLIYSFTVSKTLLTYFVIEHFLGTVLMYVFVYYADMYLSWYE